MNPVVYSFLVQCLDHNKEIMDVLKPYLTEDE